MTIGPSKAGSRDTRLDVIRGCALFTILVRHFGSAIAELGYGGPWLPTTSSLGFSSAAELFVILSGYMVGLIYLKRDKPELRMAKRALHLYAVNSLVFVAAVSIRAFFPAQTPDLFGLTPYVHATIGDIVRVATLQSEPFLLDVLSLYVQLILLATCLLWLLRRSPLLFVLCSLATYGLGQALIMLWPQATEGSAFFVPTWQLLFFLPMALGKFGFHTILFDWLKRTPQAAIAIATLLFLAFLAKHTPHLVSGSELWATAKETLGPLRVLHAILTVLGLSAAIVYFPVLQRSRLADALMLLGRNSLLCFACSIPLTYCLSLLWFLNPSPVVGYLVGCFTILSFSLLLAFASESQSPQYFQS